MTLIYPICACSSLPIFSVLSVLDRESVLWLPLTVSDPYCYRSTPHRLRFSRILFSIRLIVSSASSMWDTYVFPHWELHSPAVSRFPSTAFLDLLGQITARRSSINRARATARQKVTNGQFGVGTTSTFEAIVNRLPACRSRCQSTLDVD